MSTRPNPTQSCTPNKGTPLDATGWGSSAGGPVQALPSHPRMQVYQEHSLAWRLARWPLILLALLLTLVLLLGPGVLLGEAASVQLAWDFTQTPGHPATGFILERCTGVNCTAFVPITPSPLPLTPLTFADTTVQPATSYRWQIRAVNAQGGTSAPSNAIGFSVPVPTLSAPTNLRGQLVP